MPLDELWRGLKPACRPNAAYVFTATMKLAASLVASNKSMFRYDLVWKKTNPTGFFNAKKMPMRNHENILVFYSSPPHYTPQMTIADKVRRTPIVRGRVPGVSYYREGRKDHGQKEWRDSGKRMPLSVVEASSGSRKNIYHPTQKPVPLMDWVIRSYSQPLDWVLDPVCGSATTAVSALMNGRNVLCIEREKRYVDASEERIRKTIKDAGLEARVEVSDG